MSMSEWEIEVYGADDHDMMLIQGQLAAGNIRGEDTDDIGLYFHNGKARSVFVYPPDLGQAVAIINALGFETDEDGATEEL